MLDNKDFEQVLSSLSFLNSTNHKQLNEVLNCYPQPSSLCRFTSIKLIVELTTVLSLPSSVSIHSVEILDVLVSFFQVTVKKVKVLIAVAVSLACNFTLPLTSQPSLESVLLLSRGVFTEEDLYFARFSASFSGDLVGESILLSSVHLLTAGVSHFFHSQVVSRLLNTFTDLDIDKLPPRSDLSGLQMAAEVLLTSCLDEEFLFSHSPILCAAGALKAVCCFGFNQVYYNCCSEGISLIFALIKIPCALLDEVEQCFCDSLAGYNEDCDNGDGLPVVQVNNVYSPCCLHDQKG
ncbi:hypothetical protein RCL1_007092 [Eukaryota sp. TZLM3-RCL]